MRTRILLAPAPPADGTDTAGGAATQDAQTIDNRLSLDPSDDRWKGYVDEWQDGETYTVTLKVSQISPGEFEVMEMTDGKAADEAKPGEGAAGGEPMGEMSMDTDNPAVKNLMK